MTHSDLENTPATDFTGRAVIDGDKSRVEFVSGIGYQPGTYLISTNGSRILTYVDPGKKTYVEVNAGSVSAVVGSAKITITNKKVDLTQLEDHPIIAGLPTDHFRLAISYEITLSLGSLDLKQAVHTVEDKFVTNAFGDVGDTYLASGALKTGNPEIDDLIDIENTRVKGFALRQIITTTTTNGEFSGQQSAHWNPRNITTTREITITAITPKASVPAAVFMVPVGFRRVDPMKDDTQKAPLHVLSMEPPASK